MLAVAMGLQNAMIMSWSGAVLRTTHMTETATDMSGARQYHSEALQSQLTPQDLQQPGLGLAHGGQAEFVLMTCLLVRFVAGCARQDHRESLPSQLTPQDLQQPGWDEHMADRQKLVLMTRLLVSSSPVASSALLRMQTIISTRSSCQQVCSSGDWDERMLDRHKLILMTCLLVKFVLMTCLLVIFVAPAQLTKTCRS